MIRLLKKIRKDETFLLFNGDVSMEVFDYMNAIVKLDNEGNVISYNQPFAKQYGYSKEDFSQPFFKIFLKDYSLDIVEYIENAFQGIRQEFASQVVTKNGHYIDVHITLIPNKDSKDMDVVIKNITEYQHQKKEVVLAKKSKKLIGDLKDVCNFYYDAINDYYYFTKQFASIFGINDDVTPTLSLNQMLRYIHPDNREFVKNTVLNAMKDRTGYEIEYRILQKDGKEHKVFERAEIYLDCSGNLDGFVGIIQDITLHNVFKELMEEESVIERLYDNPDVGIWSFDVLQGKYSNSKGLEQISGFTVEDLNDQIEWKSIVHPDDVQTYIHNQLKLNRGEVSHQQYRIIQKNGVIKWVLEYTIPKLDSNGNLIRLFGVITDITDKKMLEEKIQFMANYDLLTKLPNRNRFIEKLEKLIEEYSQRGKQFAVLKMDIDRFKYINDTLGSEVGDELLKQFTNRVNRCLREKDMFARAGSDEFMISIEDLKSINTLNDLVKRINEYLEQPFHIQKQPLYITVSIGISIYPDNGKKALELLRNANLALHEVKKTGGNNYHILSHTNSIQSFKDYSLSRDIKKVIENNEMTLYFQPRVDTETNQIIGAEALIRWNHPEWGLISPHAFIPIAEENGVISAIDEWVFKEVCCQIRDWKHRELNVVPISINVSTIDFLNSNLLHEVTTMIENGCISPEDVEFEITESMLLSKSEQVNNSIMKLKELGLKIILDDFGKGYSTLSYLTQCPFDVIKIDRSFVQNMLYGKGNIHLVKSIIYIARGLNIRIIAEGVETLDQLKILQQEQCHEIQGYLYSRPVPLHKYEVLLKNKELRPIDPTEKNKKISRRDNRLIFPYPLEADMSLVSVAGRKMKLGVAKILIEDISVGGLRFVSNLKLPIRGDVVYRFTTELLHEEIVVYGGNVWKEEINDHLFEYGVKFKLSQEGQSQLATLLDTFIELLKNSTTLPPYRKVDVSMYEYFR